MKKILVGAVFSSLLTGTYFIIKDIKKGKSSSKSQKNNSLNNYKIVDNNLDAVEEMYKVKINSAQAVYERHTEAASILSDTFKNIMEEIDSSDKNIEYKTDIIEDNNIETIHELDSLSDELDKLLK